MATYYWVGGSGVWDESTGTNWAFSSGGPGNAGVPTAADDVVFDANSDTGGPFTVTVGGGSTTSNFAFCRTFSTGGAGGALDQTMTLGGVGRVLLYGSMTLPATNYVHGASVVLNFQDSATLTTNGVSISQLTIGSLFSRLNEQLVFNLGSALTAVSGLSINTGTFNTNNFSVTVVSLNFGIPGSAAAPANAPRIVNLGSSTITLTGTSVTSVPNLTNLTFNAGTSTIVCSSANVTFSSGGLTFNSVSFTSTAAGIININGNNTFANLSFAGKTVTTLSPINLQAGTTQTITGTLTFSAGTSAVCRHWVRSSVLRSQATINVAAVSALSNIDFRDIVVTGAASPISGTRLGNALNNSGITFAAGVSKFWNLAGGGNTTSTAWALTSGGAVSVDNYPLAQDTVVIENTGLNSGATITFSTSASLGPFTTATRTLPVTIAFGTNSPNFCGNVTLSSAVTLTGSGAALSVFGYGGTQTITSAGVTWPKGINFANLTGTVAFADALTVSGACTFGLTTASLCTFTFKEGTTNSSTAFSFTNSSVGSAVPGSQYTLSQTSGVVVAKTTTFQDAIATGGATWTAPLYYGNVNSGNNSGWTFSGYLPMQRSTAFGFGFGFSQASSAGAPASGLTASLAASRISGTAPLAIHFDATGTASNNVADDFREITYSFNYGDPGSGTWSTNGQSKNTDSGGPLGAHVYDTPGTYTVTLNANDGTASSSTSVTITVANPDTVYSGTNTICIDPTGGTTGGPAGCQYVTSMPTIISNRRYLIRRGQTISSFTVPSTVTGVRIGAYGTGAKPIITGQIVIGNSSTPTVAQWAEDVVISDLAGDSGATINQCGRNLMLLRCDFVNTSPTGRTVINCDNVDFFAQVQYNTITDAWGSGDSSRVLARSDFYVPKYIFVVECYQRGNSSVDTNPGGLYMRVDCGALMGNDLRDADFHAHRFYFARKTLIQHSSLQHTSYANNVHAIKLHSGGTNPPQANVQNQPDGLAWYSELNVIRRNTLGASDSPNTWTVAVRPQNTGGADPPLGQEGVQDTIVEDNSFIDSPSTSRDIIVGPARRTTTRGNTRNNGAIRIDQDNNVYPAPFQTEWRGPYYGQFTGAQTLSPSLFTNSSTFYSPAVTTTGNNVSIVAIPNTSFGTSQNTSVTAPAANEVLVLYLASNTGSTINSSLTDSGGGTWTFDVGTATNFGFYRRSGGSTSGSITVSWTTSSGDVCWGAAFYLSNMNTAAPLDSTTSFSSFGFTTTPSVSITTTANDCIVLGQIYRTGGGTPTLTPTAPAQLYQDATYTNVHILYLVNAGAAGAKTLEGTWSAGSGGERFAVAYKPA